MIIWINGAYGSGKSTVAERIAALLPDAHLFDAEAVGNAVRDNLQKAVYHVEFPDYAIWRRFVAELLIELADRTDAPILVPMTVLKEEYLDDIFARLTARGVAWKHFILSVDPERIHERILNRGEDEDCWCMRQKDRCPQLLAELSGIRIDAARPVDEVAQEIMRCMQ